MNAKVTATCSNGHVVEWGSCKGQVKKLFGGTKECGSNLFDEIDADAKVSAVSIGEERWNAVRCKACGTIFSAKACEKCGVQLRVSEFKKKGFWAKLG